MSVLSNKTKKCPKNECIAEIWVMVDAEERWLSFFPKVKVRTIHYSNSSQNYQIILTGGIRLGTTLPAITASRP